MENELRAPEDFTVLLGRKPVSLPPPIMLKHEVEYDHIEVDPYFKREPGDPDYITVPVSQSFQIWSAGRLYATSNRYILKKDLATGHTTLRLFKNKTRLH